MKKLFGCVSVCQILLPVILLLCTITGVKANNIRVEGKTRVTGFTGDTAVIEVTLRWDNSWRDDFNWDAAWVFFKFKKRGLENPWQHAYLSSSGHVLSTAAGNEGGGYAYMVGANAGKVNGLYVMRNGISEGNVSIRLQAKWPLNGTGLTSADFGDALNGIYVAVHAIEMVYVPYGAYYLGDAFSYDNLQNKAQGSPLPSVYDIIDNNSGYEYSIKSSVITGSVDNIADRSSAAAYPNSSLYFNAVGGGWVQIDFKTPKTIRYFGVSAASNYCAGNQDCRPKGNWYLTGSNDSLTWTRLYTGVNTDWWGTGVAYPVQNTLKVTHPGSYRYYRIEMSGAVRTDDGIVIQSIAMTEKDLESCVVDSEEALTLASSHTSWTGTLSASYPKGYAGFYVMKYETSQEQYVEFLNSLTLEQQKARVANNNFSTMNRGDYVFGDIAQPSCRNGIVFIEQRKENTPVVFGNNLNSANDLFSTDDGQTLACNYMSIEDMIAYCSWSGLRPMSELEYEKACRRFYPQVPDKGEYAWNTNNGVNHLSSLSDLNFRGDEREQAVSYLKNVNSGTTNSINGPVRCGMFGTSATNQSQSGATYWGVMEMSGNLKELCANVNYSNLDGSSSGTGVYNPAYWSTAVGSYGVRGGGFNSADSLLRTSDRTEAINYFTTITERDSTVGFRGVYSLSGIKIDGGEIQCSPDTICPGDEANILNIKAASCPDFPDVRFQYTWYVKKPGEARFELMENINGETLRYSKIEDFIQVSGTYEFKRMCICALGIAETITTLTILFKTAIIAQDLNVSNLFCNGIILNLTIQGSFLTCQWVKNNENIPGANAAVYRKNPLSAADNGTYFCRVSGSCGTEYSDTISIVYPIEDSTMLDSRDGKIYKIRKMPDGHWWMVEDLRFGNCNASVFNSYYKGSISNKIASGYWGVCRPGSGSGAGYMYNWQGAMNNANARYNGGNPSGNVNGNSPIQWQGICPPGWHLPSGGSTGEFQKLYTALCYTVNKIYPGTGTFEGKLGGYAQASVNLANREGNYWSSTYTNAANARKLYFTSSGVNANGSTDKFNGFTVRCVKNY